MAEIITITAQKAWDILQKEPRSLIIDIRANMEFLFVGHPKGAHHIAWIDEPDWEINPNFVSEVRKLLLGGVICTGDEEGCVKIILICRAGYRSLEAGRILLDAGLGNIYSVEHGFEGQLDQNHQRSTVNGWRQAGLPWEQC